MITLGTLKRRRSAKHRIKRVGRGYGSGHGGHEATRGIKGQKSRKGSSFHPSFEGGQMPLVRRVPKRGFINIFRREYQIVNVERLTDFPMKTIVDVALLKKENIIRSEGMKVKILGKGKLKDPLVVKAHAFSSSARKKIEEVGGKAEVLSGGN